MAEVARRKGKPTQAQLFVLVCLSEAYPSAYWPARTEHRTLRAMRLKGWCRPKDGGLCTPWVLTAAGFRALGLEPPAVRRAM